MKKLIAFTLLVCCIMMQTVFVGADSPPGFEAVVTADSMEVGDTAYLLINLKDNEAFGALQFSVTYDSDILLLESAATGELVPQYAMSSVNSDIAGEIHFSLISLEDITDSGTVLVAKFRGLKKGISALDFALAVYASSDGTSLDYTVTDAQIVVGHGAISGGDSGVSGISGGMVTPSQPSDVTDGKQGDADSDDGTALAEPIAFADVDESHWAYSQVIRMAQMGLFGGTGGGMFSPGLPMTRAMFVTVLHRYAETPRTEGEGVSFDDVAEDDYFADAVSWAAASGIVNGVGDGKFSPHTYITRGEIAAVLFRYVGGTDTAIDLTADFADGDSVPEWGRKAVSWAVENSILTGRPGGIVAFSDSATRAEAAVVFSRFLNISKTER